MEINICKEFSDTPNARYKSEGPFSGEEFREELLEPRYLEAREKGEKLTINIDGGYVEDNTEIKLSTNDNSVIYYTTNGSFPTNKSTKLLSFSNFFFFGIIFKLFFLFIFPNKTFC